LGTGKKVASQIRNLGLQVEDERLLECPEVVEEVLQTLLRLTEPIKIVICVTRPARIPPYQKLVVIAMANIMVPTLNKLVKKGHTVKTQSCAKDYRVDGHDVTAEEDFTVAEWERKMPSLKR
jgi:hypothetical protein